MIASVSSRLRCVLGIIAFGLISGMALSWNLWMGDRAFPYFPVLDFIPQFPHLLDVVVLVGFWSTAAWLVWKPNRSLVFGLLGLMVLYALQDQMRWQPWFYQYLLMLVPFLFYRWGEDENEGALGLLQMIVVMVYLWGGIHKCHIGFINVWNESLAKPLLEGLENESLISVIKGAGYLVPPVEILIGIGLVFKRTRFVAIAAALGTHVIILILLGPVKGYVSNSVVWPWNLVMMALVVVLFYKVEQVSFFTFRKTRMAIAGYCLWVLMVFAPVLFYADLLDRYLSFNLYTGRQARLVVFVKEAEIPRLPMEWIDFYSNSKNKGYKVLNLSKWSRSELNVPMLTEPRILLRFCEYASSFEGNTGGFIYYIDYPRLHDRAALTFRSHELNDIDLSYSGNE